MTYRFALLKESGEIVREESHDCIEDLDALNVAYVLCIEYAVEVWQDERFVARLKCGERPPQS